MALLAGILTLLVLAGGCRGLSPTPSAARTNSTCELWEAVRFYLRTGRPQQAREQLRRLCAQQPCYLPAQVLYQDMGLAAGQRQELLQEYRCRQPQWPAWMGAYLLARLEPDPSRRLLRLQQLEQVQPRSASLLLDLARTSLQQRNFPQAQQYLQRLVAAHPQDARAHYLLARLHLRRLDWQSAFQAAQQAREADPTFVPARFFFAASYLLSGRYWRAISEFRKIRRIAPHYKFDADQRRGYRLAYYRALLSLVRRQLPRSGLRLAREALTVFPQDAEFLAFKAQLLFMQGQLARARGLVQQALQHDPFNLRAVQLYRRLLFAQGEYRRALVVWGRTVPLEYILSSRNQLAARYQEVFAAAQQACNGNAQTRLRLARALARVGWDQESLAVYRTCQGWAPPGEIQALQNHQAFLAGLQAYCYRLYQRPRSVSIVQFIDACNQIARSCQIPLKTRPARELDSYFVVVREHDPFDPRPGSLGAYLARYNKFYDLGNNYGVTDLTLQNRLVLQEVRSQLVGKVINYRVLIGDESYISNRLGFRSGRPLIAGRAFLSTKGFRVAFEALRPTAATVRAFQQATRRLQHTSDPAGTDPDSRRLRLKRQLLRRFLPADFDSTDLDRAFQHLARWRLDHVWWHELGHLDDYPHFLPLGSHLWQALRMAMAHGFSGAAIEARFEEVAETFGLGYAHYPFFYLYQNLQRLEVHQESLFELVTWAWYGRKPSQDPYRRAAQHILQGLARVQAVRFPGQELTQCSRAALRSMARQVYQDRFGHQGYTCSPKPIWQ